MNVNQFEVKEGATVYVLDLGSQSYTPWYIKKNDKHESGYCLKTDDKYQKYYTMDWPFNWKDLVGKIYFLTEQDAKDFVNSRVKSMKNHIMNLTKEELVSTLYNNWVGENDRSYQECEAMKDKMEKEFGIRPER